MAGRCVSKRDIVIGRCKRVGRSLEKGRWAHQQKRRARPFEGTGEASSG